MKVTQAATTHLTAVVPGETLVPEEIVQHRNLNGDWRGEDRGQLNSLRQEMKEQQLQPCSQQPNQTEFSEPPRGAHLSASSR